MRSNNRNENVKQRAELTQEVGVQRALLRQHIDRHTFFRRSSDQGRNTRPEGDLECKGGVELQRRSLERSVCSL